MKRPRIDLDPADAPPMLDAAASIRAIAAGIAGKTTDPEDVLKESMSLIFIALTATGRTSMERLEIMQGLTTAIGVAIGDNEPGERQAGLALAGMWLSAGMLCGAQDYLLETQTPKGRA